MKPTKKMQIVSIAAALSLALGACAQDDGTTADTTVDADSGTVTTLVDDTVTTSTMEEPGMSADFEVLESQASALAAEVAEIDSDDVEQAWTTIEGHLDGLMDGTVQIDDSLKETISSDLEDFEAALEETEAELSEEFVADWESFQIAFQAALDVTS